MISVQPKNEMTRTVKKPNALSTIPTSELDLPRRIENRLNVARIETVGALVERTEREMTKLKGLSRKSVDVIRARLEAVGLEFRGQ